MDDLLFEVQEAVRLVRADLRAVGQRMDAITEREVLTLAPRIPSEAAQASPRERTRLLAHALAGVFTPGS